VFEESVVVVCHCKVVTDRDVRAAHAAGAGSVATVGRLCGAGQSCGGCRPALAELIARLTQESEPVRDLAVCA
jgi:bacterioferritin-associated ferredoxin